MQRQATARVCWSGTGICLLFAVCLIASPVLGSSSPKKRSESDRDIGAIGHRKIAYAGANGISLESEKKMGGQYSIAFERSNRLLRDATTALYVERLAQAVAQNSDVQIPVIVRVIDSEDVNATTLPGGYLYITRGLLLRVGNEGELASVLARAIAEIALRPGINNLVRGLRMDSFGMPYKVDPKVRRDEESDADYFGVQYLYKSGYDPECFINIVQTVWTVNPSSSPTATAAAAFPPLPERLQALQEEITDIFPKREGAITNTPEFTDFREHLLKLNSPESETKSESKPGPIPPQP